MIISDINFEFVSAALNTILCVFLIIFILQQNKMRKMYDMHNKLYQAYQQMVLELQVKTRELLGKRPHDA